MKLLISQKDTIYKLIQEFELSPNQFEISETSILGVPETNIAFKNSEYFLKFFSENTISGNFFVRYSPGEEVFSEESGYLNTFSSSLNLIREWLYSLSREINSPNYWEKLRGEVGEVSISSAFDNSKFTVKEFNNLSSKIDFLKSNLKEIPLLKDQNEQIIFQLDNLKSQAEELGKFDWTNLFIGTIMSIIIQLNVNRENADALWNLIKNIFSGYFLN